LRERGFARAYRSFEPYVWLVDDRQLISAPALQQAFAKKRDHRKTEICKAAHGQPLIWGGLYGWKSGIIPKDPNNIVTELLTEYFRYPGGASKSEEGVTA
jgi:hypothetical protein